MAGVWPSGGTALGMALKPELGLSSSFLSCRTRAGSPRPGSGRCWTEASFLPDGEKAFLVVGAGVSSSGTRAFCEREVGPVCTRDQGQQSGRARLGLEGVC